jgi:hypothetical protein
MFVLSRRMACALTPSRREVRFVQRPSKRCSATEMALLLEILVLNRAVFLRSENSLTQAWQRS